MKRWNTAGALVLVVGLGCGCASEKPSGPEITGTGSSASATDLKIVETWNRPQEPVALFDGTTLRGWVQRGGRASYRAEDGAIVGTTVAHSPNSFLCTEGVYGDFELELEFKVDPRVNSGVQFRSLSTAEYQNGRVHGYQAEIDPAERAWTGGLYDEGRRGWLVDLKNNAAGRKAFKQNEWNAMRIRAVGEEISIWVNGVPTVSGFKDGRTREGFIALQVHDVGKQAEPMEVRWKGLKLKRVESEAAK
jgi:hypothetical protein